MDTHTHNTRLSRRTILAGSIAAPAAAFPVFKTIAALSVPTLLALGSGPAADAELFRHIAVAEQARNQHARIQRLHARLRAVREARNDLTAPPRRESRTDAWHQCREAFEYYAAAVRNAVAVPARTVAGVHAKLRLGTIAARRGTARVYMYEDREWLETVLADLRSLADREPRT